MNKQVSTLTKKLSLEQFLMLVRKQQAELESVQVSILDAHRLLDEELELWPDQCDSVIDSIKLTRTIVKDFIRLLNDTQQIPLAVSPIRYPLVVGLHHIDALTNELMTQTNELHETCQPPSRGATMLQMEIMQYLEELAQESEDLLQNIGIFYDQIHFLHDIPKHPQAKAKPIKVANGQTNILQLNSSSFTHNITKNRSRD